MEICLCHHWLYVIANLIAGHLSVKQVKSVAKITCDYANVDHFAWYDIVHSPQGIQVQRFIEKPTRSTRDEHTWCKGIHIKQDCQGTKLSNIQVHKSIVQTANAHAQLCEAAQMRALLCKSSAPSHEAGTCNNARMRSTMRSWTMPTLLQLERWTWKASKYEGP